VNPELTGLEATLLPFEQTEYRWRIPSPWVPPQDVEQVRFRMLHPEQFCPASYVGHFGLTIRYLPCVDRPGRGGLCEIHQRLIPAARTAPAPPPQRVAPAPPPQLAPPGRCTDCGDQLPRWRQLPHCIRCNKVRLEAAAEARAREHRVRAQPQVYHCLACRQRIGDPGHGPRLCSRCLTERYVEQPADDQPLLERSSGDLPRLAYHVNKRGESVVGGRVLPHNAYGRSRWDASGDTPE
jgi:hypothetical protein